MRTIDLRYTAAFCAAFSSKGGGYISAAIEFFFHFLKFESTKGKRYTTWEDARTDVFGYIES